MKHCNSQQCLDSIVMMCDHESFLATQYYLDQSKHLLAHFRPQNIRNASLGLDGLVFDKGMFSNTYNKALCDEELNWKRMGNAHTSSASTMTQNELYMRPCPIPTFANSIKCTQNGTQCCSQSHQLFNNFSRAGTGTAPPKN